MKRESFRRRVAEVCAPMRGLLTREVLLLLAVFGLALVLRLAWIAYANYDPADGRFGDDVFYDRAAQALAAGKGYVGFSDQQTANWPPGYPLLLAAIYKVFGHSILAANVLNAFAGAAACLLVYAVGTKVFSRRVGLLAAGMLAVFPGQVYYSAVIMTEAISPAVLTLLILLVLTWTLGQKTPSAPRLLVLGVLFGAAALMRGEAGMLLLMVLVLWKLAIPSWRRFAWQGGILVLGAALAIMPWTIRNLIAMDAFIPIASGVGHGILAAHQSDPYNLADMFPEGKIHEKYAYLPLPEREVKVEREAMREGLEYMVSHPGNEVRLLFEKFYHLYKSDSDALASIHGAWVYASDFAWLKNAKIRSLDEVGKPVVTIPPSAQHNWSRLADGYYYLIMMWAGVGAFYWFSLRDKKRLLLVLFVLGWTLVHLIFKPNPRYHAPLTPIFCLWAALLLVTVWDRVAAYFTPIRNPKSAGKGRAKAKPS